MFHEVPQEKQGLSFNCVVYSSINKRYRLVLCDVKIGCKFSNLFPNQSPFSGYIQPVGYYFLKVAKTNCVLKRFPSCQTLKKRINVFENLPNFSIGDCLACRQEIEGCLNFFLSYLFISQIWLNYLIDYLPFQLHDINGKKNPDSL